MFLAHWQKRFACKKLHCLELIDNNISEERNIESSGVSKTQNEHVETASATASPGHGFLKVVQVRFLRKLLLYTGWPNKK